MATEVGKHVADVLTANPDLRMLIVLPMIPDVDAPVAETTQSYGRRLAMEQILATGGDRVAVFGLCNAAGLPIYVHSKLCVIDDQWASVGSDNLNLRSWTSDSEIACLVIDERESDSAAPDDSFPVLLLRELAAEHLGCIPEEVPTDLHDLFDAFVASADALDSWYAAATAPTASARRDPRQLARHLARPRRKHGHRMDRARNTAAQTARQRSPAASIVAHAHPASCAVSTAAPVALANAFSPKGVCRLRPRRHGAARRKPARTESAWRRCPRVTALAIAEPAPRRG